MPRDDEGRRDRELLRSLAEGRQEALARLYDRHAVSLFRHAVALARNRSDAEDLVHGVFVKLAGHGADLLGVRAPASYLHRMLHTTWIDGRRRLTAAERIVAGTPAESGGPPAHDVAIDVARAVDGLPPEQREVVVLHVVEGFSFREVGHMTGVSLFTAAARYRLAVKRLRTALGAVSGVTT